LGNLDDPRRVVITEFRIIFEDADTPDFVASLADDHGLTELKKTGVSIKEGATYKFRISFLVQHEIVDALSFQMSLTKMGFGESDEIVLGSYAPQSAPHCFEYPRHGWEEAPKGMLFRGKATARCKFVDGLKNTHVEFSYPVLITKK
jgi:Rho GDP-dissociation inhibitor